MMIRHAGFHPLEIDLAQQARRGNLEIGKYFVTLARRQRIVAPVMPHIENETADRGLPQPERRRNLSSARAQNLVVIPEAEQCIDLAEVPAHSRPAAEFPPRKSRLIANQPRSVDK